MSDNLKQSIDVTVITPMYNEEAAVKANILGLEERLNQLGCDWELLVVNDGSTDASREIAERTASDKSRVKIISYSPNRGRGYALRQGFAAARGKYIITTEADMTWGADIIDRLYRALIETGSDIVIASPHLPGGRLEAVPFKRVFLSKYGNKLLTMAVPGDLTMISGMTRAYRREVIESISLESDRKEIHLEIISKALSLGFKVKEIPAVLSWADKPKNGKKTRSSFHARKYIFSHLAFSFFQKPIILFGISGAIMFFAGLLLGGLFVIQRYTGTLNPTRPLYILMILLLLGGIQMLSFGFLSTQVGTLKKEIYRQQQESLSILRLLRNLLKKDKPESQ